MTSNKKKALCWFQLLVEHREPLHMELHRAGLLDHSGEIYVLLTLDSGLKLPNMDG